MNRPTTIKDIANHLKVSPATVSRALSNHPNISLKRKKSVLEKALELNYHPDSIAQSLKSGHTNTIGVIVPAIKYHFFSEALDGIEEIASKAGYNLLLCKSNENYEREIANAKVLASNRVAGIIVSLSQNSEKVDHFSDLVKRGIPVVFFDRVPSGFKAPKVVVDDYEAAFALVEYLIQTGYRKIAHLAGREYLQISRLRLGGYRDALQKHKLTLPPEYVIFGGFEEEDGKSGYARLMALKRRPEAVFTVNDPVALGVYAACKRDGVKIPEDLAVAGFSDNPISALLDPPLTTVSQPAYEMGMAAAKLLLEQLKPSAPKDPLTQVCPTRLIVRKST